MDVATKGTETFLDLPISSIIISSPEKRQCCEVATNGEFPLSAIPTLVLHILGFNLDPKDLVNLEATCSFFRKPANCGPDHELSLAELAALDMCHNRAIFKPMSEDERQELKRICGGSWKLVLRFLIVGETCTRREKSQAIAGPGHSIAVNSKGVVYSFGSNVYGELGHGTMEHDWRPRQIRSLQGIRIIQAAASIGRTMLVSDAGQVYAFGKDSFGYFEDEGIEDEEPEDGEKEDLRTPQLVESLKNIFVVQAAIGNLFTAVLSREGRVYTFSWGNENKLGHNSDPDDREPHPLLGALENKPVVQIAAGYCFLIALVCEPSGMSVYSVGCGLGGKLGHGTKTTEKLPRLIECFRTLKFEPAIIAAGPWHSAVVGRDGRVCTWGWGNHGCLGHDYDDMEVLPRVVESLSGVKAIHVAVGEYTTFVISDEGHVHSFGCNTSSSLGRDTLANPEERPHGTPKMVTSLAQMNERVVQISNSAKTFAHTLALTDSGNLFSFGSNDSGQLGAELLIGQSTMKKPHRVNIDLS